MALPNTVQEAFPGVTFPGAARPVVAKDQSQGVTMYDDFVFDFLDPNCFAGGTRPAVGAAIPTAGFVNLAPDAALALGRTGAVTAVPSDATKLPLVTAKGISFLAGTNEALQILKGGVASNRVMEPTLEGFLQHLLIVYFKQSASVTGGGFLNAGQTGGSSQWGGIYELNGRQIYCGPYQNGLGLTATLGTWYQAAVAITYNTTDNTATQRMYINGAVTSSVTGAATYTGTNNAFAKALIGGRLGAATMTGEIGRARRVLNVGAALATADMDAIVAADFAWKMPLLLAA